MIDRSVATKQNHAMRARRGIATLELVMCMPVLLLLMIGIVWLGLSVIGQASVIVEARHKAWEKRFDEGTQKPLRFLSDDFAEENATTNVNMGPLFNDVSSPKSSHDVAIDTWDHGSLEMNNVPNWELYVTAAVNAKTGGLQVQYEDARGKLRSLQQIASRQIVEEMANVIREALEDPLGVFKGQAGDSERSANDESEREKRKLKRRIDQLEDEIEKTEEHVRDMKDELKDAEGDAKKSLESRIEVGENKVKRLKKSLERLESDYKAAG